MASESLLRGRRILVVEDEVVISLSMEQLLADHGCKVVGPAYDVAGALALVDKHKIDCGVLDIRLGDEMVYEVAEALNARGIPIVFVTGYAYVDDRFSDVPVIQKPFKSTDIENALLQTLSKRL